MVTPEGCIPATLAQSRSSHSNQAHTGGFRPGVASSSLQRKITHTALPSQRLLHRKVSAAGRGLQGTGSSVHSTLSSSDLCADEVAGLLASAPACQALPV